MSNDPAVVLMIDDEQPVRRFLRSGLELAEYAVYEASTGAEGIKLATLRSHDLILVDLGLPDMDGSAVVERIRGWSTVPIIVLSARTSETEKVRLLDIGADDYVVKPFGMAELLARARAAIRRKAIGATPEPVVTIGDLTVDIASRAISLAGKQLKLSPKEFRLVQILAQNAGKVVTHQHLLREIWGAGHADASHYLRILVRKVRQEIEADPTRPKLLQTELGVGYRLAGPTDVSGKN
jgi:two-component system, OmpR family, KDP operon response regulator KdpE